MCVFYILVKNILKTRYLHFLIYSLKTFPVSWLGILYTHIHVHTHTYIHILTYIHTCIYTHMHTHTLHVLHTCIYCILTYTQTQIHTYTCICTLSFVVLDSVWHWIWHKISLWTKCLVVFHLLFHCSVTCLHHPPPLPPASHGVMGLAMLFSATSN